MRKWQLREVKQLNQGYPPHEKQSWERDWLWLWACTLRQSVTYLPTVAERKSENWQAWRDCGQLKVCIHWKSLWLVCKRKRTHSRALSSGRMIEGTHPLEEDSPLSALGSRPSFSLESARFPFCLFPTGDSAFLSFSIPRFSKMFTRGQSSLLRFSDKI